MILTPDFVYVHMPKTGGTFVARMLARVYGERAVELAKHCTVEDIPASHAHLPIVGTRRSPFERYVSQWRFGWWQRHPELYCGEEAMRRAFPSYPELSFAEFLELADTLFVGRYRGEPNGFENRLPAERRLGWHTEVFLRFFFRRPREVFAAVDDGYIEEGGWREDLVDVRFLRVESLNRDLHNLLLDNGQDAAAVAFVLDAGRELPEGIGRDPSDRWQANYTPELLDLVRRRERLLLRIFPELDVGPEAAEAAA